MSEEKWSRFGWQGLYAEVPAEWELVGIPKQHDPAEGYLRLDDAIQPRLEIKWKAHSERKFDIDKTLDEYLSGIRKTYEKEVGPIDVRRDQTLIPNNGPHTVFHQHREVVFFSWRAALRAYGVIWRCELCQRVVMAQVIGSDHDHGLRQTAVRVFESLRDHPSGDTNLWTAYGLEIDVPRRHRLEKLELLNGYILFSFSDGALQIAVERYGLAEQLLRNDSLEAWFRRTYRKSLRGSYFVLDTDPDDARVLRLTGRDQRTLDLVDRWDIGVSRAWDRLFRRSRMFAYAWVGPKGNRIYVVRTTGKARLAETGRRIVQSIPQSGAAFLTHEESPSWAR